MEPFGVNEEQVLLKTRLFGGFDKSEVLGAIDRLREQNRELEKRNEKLIQEISLSRSQYTKQVAGFEQRFSETQSLLEDRCAKIKELSGTVETLQGELNRYKQEAADVGGALEIQKEKYRQHLIRLQDAEAKARHYDDLSNQIGQILLDARQNAGDVVAAAHARAGQITAEAHAASERMVDRMGGMREDLDQIRGSLETMMKTFLSHLDEIGGMLDNAQRYAAPDEERETQQDEIPLEPQLEVRSGQASDADEFFRFAARA